MAYRLPLLARSSPLDSISSKQLKPSLSVERKPPPYADLLPFYPALFDCIVYNYGKVFHFCLETIPRIHLELYVYYQNEVMASDGYVCSSTDFQRATLGVCLQGGREGAMHSSFFGWGFHDHLPGMLCNLPKRQCWPLEGIFLSLYCVTCPRWFRWPSLVVLIIYCVTLLILSALIGTAGYATTLKNILLASFVAGYLLIDVAYLLAFHLRQGGEGDVHFHFLWNIGLCCIVWLGTLASFICYSNVKIDFLTSLWVSRNTNHHSNIITNGFNR